MIFNLFRKNTANDAVYAVYAAIVAQSRQPHFYADWGVPDTVTGRFDMICLHLALLFRRLRSEGKPVSDFAQAVFDLFFKDMDRSLREMGVGDLSVPKKIQKMGNLFYGLMTSVNEAMDRGDPTEVQAIIRRNLFDGSPEAAADRLTTYLFAEAERLQRQPTVAIISGKIDLGAAP